MGPRARKILVGSDGAEYEEAKVLGSGAHGKASLVVRKGDDALFVIKHIFVGGMKESERAACDREVALLRQVGAHEHPNIIRYYEHFYDGDDLCIVTNYAQDGDLHQLLEWHRERGYMGIPEADLLTLLAQLCSALRLLHGAAILHRDLKPNNIFVSNSFNLQRVLLGDFGIARQLSAKTTEVNTVVGTPFYFSPEVCAGKMYDFKSDIWSLGCVIYEMMTLRRAFPGESLPVVIMAIHNARYERLQPGACGYSPDLVSIVDRCLCRDPAMRPRVEDILAVPAVARAAAEFEQAVADLGGQEMITPPPRSPMSPAMRGAFSPSFASSPVGGGSPAGGRARGGVGSSSSRDGGGSRGSRGSAKLGMLMGPGEGEEAGASGWLQWGGGLREPEEDVDRVARMGVEELGWEARIKSVHLGRYFIVAVTVGGEVYSWMYGGEEAEVEAGELGHGDVTKRFFPHRVEGLDMLHVARVACGAQHTLALLQDGGVVTWGCGEEGQLGVGHTGNALVPVPVEALRGVHVTLVAAGARHSLAVGSPLESAAGSTSSSGGTLVYTWGAGEEGQLGHGPAEASDAGSGSDDEDDEDEDEDDVNGGAGDGASSGERWGRRCRGELLPRPLESHLINGALVSGERVEGAACGEAHTVLLIQGMLFSWGAGDRGQLGRADPQWDAAGRPGWSAPGPVAALDDAGEAVLQVSCGAHHCAALCSPSGRIYLWGESKSIPGNSSPAPVMVDGPWEAEGDAIRQVACGDMFTCCLSASGRVYSWGAGHGGRLGWGGEKDAAVPGEVGGALAGRRAVLVACTTVLCGDEDHGAQTLALVM